VELSIFKVSLATSIIHASLGKKPPFECECENIYYYHQPSTFSLFQIATAAAAKVQSFT